MHAKSQDNPWDGYQAMGPQISTDVYTDQKCSFFSAAENAWQEGCAWLIRWLAVAGLKSFIFVTSVTFDIYGIYCIHVYTLYHPAHWAHLSHVHILMLGEIR